jgi:hypothetical protein
MSRIRYIKPGFFQDEDLADCQPFARLLFAGLWTIADREGRLEDRPRRIRATLFPYDPDLDVDALLDELHNLNLIVRYEYGENQLICIPGWERHQKPHPREAPSIYPPPDYTPPRRTPNHAKACTGQDLGVARTGGMGNGDGDGDGDGLRPFTDSLPGIVVEEVKETTSNGFAAFWKAYPNKQGKVMAERRWRAMKPTERAAAAVVAFSMSGAVERGYRERDKCPHGSTFLNQRRWEEWDEGPPPGYGPAENLRHDKTTEDNRIVCWKCSQEVTADDMEEAVFIDRKGWHHRLC